MGESDSLFSLVLWSLFIIALAFIFLVLLRKFTKSSWPSSRSSLIKIIEHRRLSQTHELYLIDVAGQRLLIGATKERMVKLADIPNEIDPAPYGAGVEEKEKVI